MTDNGNSKRQVQKTGNNKRGLEGLMKDTQAIAAWWIMDAFLQGLDPRVEIIGIGSFANVVTVHDVPIFTDFNASVQFGEGWTFNSEKGKAYRNVVVILNGEPVTLNPEIEMILHKTYAEIKQRRENLPQPVLE